MSIDRAFQSAPAVDSLLLCGVNHRSAEVEIREKFARSSEEMRSLLSSLQQHDAFSEVAFVGTCNRVELIGVCAAPDAVNDARRKLREELLQGERSPSLVELQGEEVIRHLIRVATGLDSMVLGEPQILGQMKSAYQVAHDLGSTRLVLNRLFPWSFSAAKRIRTQTRLGENAVSVAYAARELALQVFDDISNATVILLGTGEMGSLTLRHLRSAGVEKFLIASRSMKRAQELASKVGGIPLAFENVHEVLLHGDIIVGCTNHDLAELFTSERMKKNAGQRAGKPQLYIDLGVPRNFPKFLGDDEGSFLYDIDDLRGIVARNIDERKVRAEAAEVLVSEEVEGFVRWLKRRESDSQVSEVLARGQAIGLEELQRTRRRLLRCGFTSEQLGILDAALRDLVGSVTTKVLYPSISEIRGKDGKDEEERVENEELPLLDRRKEKK